VPLTRPARIWLQRASALVLLIVIVPTIVALATVSDDAPVREGEPAPRTVIATQLLRLVDQEATEVARRTAAESVEPVVVFDDEASAAIVSVVRDVFAKVAAARRPVVQSASAAPTEASEPGATAAPSTPVIPGPEEQLTTLLDSVPQLGVDALSSLVALSDVELAQVESETLGIAQRIARRRIAVDEVAAVVDEQLVVELPAAVLPEGIGQLVVAPLITAAALPTEQIDPDATAAARERAAQAVQQVVVTWAVGDVLVSAGDVVTPLQAEAVRSAGLEGTDITKALAEAFGAMIIAVVAGVVWLRSAQPRFWASGRHVLLLATLLTGYAVLLLGVGRLAQSAGSVWWFLAPAGALAILGALLLSPVVGMATAVPAVLMALVLAGDQPAAIAYVVGTSMLSVSLVSELSSRVDLRKATLRTLVGYPAIAVIAEGILGGADEFLLALVAGAAAGIGTALLVQGILPFLESVFRLPTMTALLDLAARDHPLLRELEQKALGSYQHSVMVASLVERACRAIGANALLGGVAALYHDIGKVRQPHFFIENQQGIANPHDDIEPQVSAIIIQNHVVDGVELARTYRLPPQVVAAIGSHHGTMLVSYFYNKALDAAGGDHALVDEADFRYRGRKPQRKEAAVLFIADSCEAATRAAAMKRGTLPRQEIEETVDRLIQERLDDHQLDDADLTFAELTTVRNQIVEALVGIYHPRIDYPAGELARGRRSESAPSV